jgi:exopolysaccharide biosynthesis predicted pyruvyltransferase EpsI
MKDNLEVTAKQIDRRPARAQGDPTLLQGLRGAIDSTLAPLLSQHSRCALISFPNSPNVGDSAIWTGEVTWLERAGIDVVYACNRFTYSRSRLRRELGDGLILIHGGGNLGDLWPVAQTFRERIVTEFPDNPIIQLPQSVWFREPKNAKRAARILNRHSALHLLIRDAQSLQRAREIFAADSSLCPDMSFVLELPPQRFEQIRDVVWLLRRDLEAAEGDMQTPEGALTLDWSSDLPPQLRRPRRTYLGYVANAMFSAGIKRWPLWLPAPYRPIAASYDRRAQQRVNRGQRILNLGQVFITNRLHGHILGCIAGQPHVILGDKYGKLRSFYDTWTSEFSLASFAGSIEEAQVIASELLKEHVSA